MGEAMKKFLCVSMIDYAPQKTQWTTLLAHFGYTVVKRGLRWDQNIMDFEFYLYDHGVEK